MIPIALSDLRASLTAGRPTPNILHSSRSEGSRSPGLNSPDVLFLGEVYLTGLHPRNPDWKADDSYLQETPEMNRNVH